MGIMIGEVQKAFTGAVERALESTVNVSSTTRPPFRIPGPHPHKGIGSGVVMDNEGHIITNQHVVAGSEKTIITLANGRVFGGTVIGGDDETDIAVVKVDSDELRPAQFGNSQELKVGQPVLAIGNPLGLSGGPTVTSGVISSLQRSLKLGDGNGLRVIQTDAPVNPGNSGGPLVDLDGKAVAITTAMIPQAKGIGFAVPINTALKVAGEIIEHGGVRRPWLGIVGYDVNTRLAHRYGLSSSRGVFVVEVSSSSPAADAGLRVGDVILSLSGEATAGIGDLMEIIKARGIGESVEMEVERRGDRVKLRSTLGTRPF